MSIELRQVLQHPNVSKQRRSEDMDTIASTPTEFEKARVAMIPNWKQIVTQTRSPSP
jgi:hypothetical protein